MKYFTSLTLFLFASAFLYSQINGLVVDAETNKPLVGVNITGENTGTASDDNGRFSIDVQAGEELTLLILDIQRLRLLQKMI